MFFIEIVGLDVVCSLQNQVSVGMYVVAVGIEKISSAAAARMRWDLAKSNKHPTKDEKGKKEIFGDRDSDTGSRTRFYPDHC